MDIARIQHLCEILDGHLERYQKLVDYINQEKTYLLALDLDGLFASSRAKETLGLDIQDNINTLVLAIGEVALMLGWPDSCTPTLAELARHLPRPYDNRINDGAIKLARLKNVILRENESNRKYIEEALRLVDESINILTGANQLKGDGYQKDGSQGAKKLTLPVKLSREV